MKKFFLNAAPILVVCLVVILSLRQSTAQEDSPPIPISAPTGNQKIADFGVAKKILHEQIYRDRRQTFYCGAIYDENKKITNYGSYQVLNRSNPRAQRIEWEHIVPAENFGRSFSEWREGHPECVDSRGKRFKGRRCAGKASQEFQRMEADLHNLVPAIGELNQRRSNFSFTAFQSPQSRLPQPGCQIYFYERKVQPPPETWGDIARIYLYMDWAYPNHQILSEGSRKLFNAWNKLDPTDEWECERVGRIAKVQGNTNPFVHCPTQAKPQ